MPHDTEVSQLIINTMTQAQYDAIEFPSNTQLYLTPDTTLQNDFSNVSQSGKNTAMSWDKVDYSAGIDFLAPATTLSYTAPCDGIVVYRVLCGTSIYSTSLKINDIAVPFPAQVTTGEYYGTVSYRLSPGDVAVLDVNNASAIHYAIFYPLKGAVVPV